jgi:5-histidylcysteine sulfoxide synthase/putative 4-mercaptohistidine N1-methyltranferase
LNTNHNDWPSVTEVTAYRNKVRQTVDDLIRTMTLTMPVDWDNPFWIILMGIEHARIHVETSSVLIRQIPIQYLKPIPSWNICPGSNPAPENSLVQVAGSRITTGKSSNDPIYGWDNEYGTHKADIMPFKASKYLCSNGEFLQFVESGGYQNECYWTEEGLKWKNFIEAKQPLFWRQDVSGWKLRLVFNEIVMPWNWPVEVNYLEAKAFCNWKSDQTGLIIRLPSEDEWFVLYKHACIADQTYWETAPGNINMEHFQSPCPIDKFSFGEFYDLIGNVWQWTETSIYGFDGFKIHPSYDDFSTPTFDMRHNLIKGGSWISTGNEATGSARYAFRRHFYQHAGFRYVESPNDVVTPQIIYETDTEVVLNCEAHYGIDFMGFKNYFQEIAEIAAKFAGINRMKALDLGCRTGRTTWELAKVFDHVTGLDYTARNIRVAAQLQESGNFNYVFPEEGELLSYHHLNINELGFDKLANKVRFLQSDPSNMKSVFIGYDLIVVNNILGNVNNPRQFLQSIHSRINAGGRLIFATDYEWNDPHTTSENRIGGYRDSGEQIWGEDDLSSILGITFTKIEGPIIVPSVKRINKRKFEFTNVDVTIWEKKE